jgi:pimeloyl-ACP methyl ester carboxylesterase
MTKAKLHLNDNKWPDCDTGRRAGLRVRVMGIFPPEVLNDSGSRTIILLGGDGAGGGGVLIKPLAAHSDYAQFLSEATKSTKEANWRIVALSGEDYPNQYDDTISNYGRTYSKRDGKKCILIGHSAGAMAGLFYARDRPSEKFFDRIILFNVPLIYPSDEVVPIALQRLYLMTDKIQVNVTIVMSKNDDVLGPFKLKDGTTIWDAIKYVEENAKKVDIETLNVKDYHHSPFNHNDVAWNRLNERRFGISRMSRRVKRSRIYRSIMSS